MVCGLFSSPAEVGLSVCMGCEVGRRFVSRSERAWECDIVVFVREGGACDFGHFSFVLQTCLSV